MQRTAELQRSWVGLALLSRGFRPFFLFAALWAVAAIAIWPPFFTGEIRIPTAFAPVDWHVHEMIYGYGAAVVAGFLLTAIPNWTGRLPVAGGPLALLASLWVLGRIAVFFSEDTGRLMAALLDCAFLFTFAAVTGREVLAGKNWRNVKVVALVLLLAIANVGFHIEAAGGSAPISSRGGLAVLVFLILLIGGRVVPSFTHNWLAKQGIDSRPTPFGKMDAAIMVVSAIALLSWIFAPEAGATGVALWVAGVANLWRLARWCGWRTGSDRLVLVLHVGFLLAALGFLFAGTHALWPRIVPTDAAGIHVWAIGAIGIMTLAMMTRATLGHTGRALAASTATQLIYGAVIVATLARVLLEFDSALMLPLLYVAAMSWIAAFAGFAVIYGRMLAR